MSSDEKDSADISRALKKLDEDASRLEVRKKIRAQSTRREVPREKIDREDVITKENEGNNRKVLTELTQNSAFLFLLFLTVAMISYTLTKDERTTLIEHLITGLLIIGMVALKR